MKESENKEKISTIEKRDTNYHDNILTQGSTASIFTNDESEKELKSKSYLLEENMKFNIEKNLISNLRKNSENDLVNETESNITLNNNAENKVTLGIRYSTNNNNKNQNENNSNSKKKKSIYYGQDENKIKLNVLGSEGKNIYDKMNKYLKKFQKDVIAEENIPSYLKKKSIVNYKDAVNNQNTSKNKDLKNNNNRDNIVTSPNVSFIQSNTNNKNVKIDINTQNSKSVNKKSYHLSKSVKTALPNYEMFVNPVDLKQKLEFEEAQRAAIIMRKLEYSKGTHYKKNKIVKSRRLSQYELDINLLKSFQSKNIKKENNIYNYNENESKNDVSNVQILAEINEKDDEIEKLIQYKFLLDLNFFQKLYIERLQKWWKKKYEFILKIKFLQHHLRQFLLNRKFPKDFQKLIFLLFNINSVFKKIEKRKHFKKLKSYYLMITNSLTLIIKIQRKIKRFLNLRKINKLSLILKRFFYKRFLDRFYYLNFSYELKQTMEKIIYKMESKHNFTNKNYYFNKLKTQVLKINHMEQFIILINKSFIKFSFGQNNLKENLFKYYGVNLSENVFHEINLNSNSGKDSFYNNKIKKGHNNNKENNPINIELESRKISTSKLNKKEIIVNSLNQNDSVLNSSNKSIKIVLKSSSRDFINEENTENKLTKVSSNTKLKINEDLINSKIEKIKHKKSQYIIDDDVESKNCYHRNCQCILF